MAHTRFSFISSIASIAFIAVAAFSTATAYVQGVCSRIVHTWTAVADRFVDLVKSVVGKFEQPALRLVARPVELVQACAYALRLAKRERPHVRDTWRMCPST